MTFALGGIPFRNDSGKTIPAYGLMRVTGIVVVEGMPVVTVDQQDSMFRRSFLLNGPIDCPAGGETESYGTAQDGSYPAFALFDSSTLPEDQDDPNYGDHWGPAKASWHLAYGREGFYGLGGNYGQAGEDDDPGTQRTIVRPYEIKHVVCKLTAELDYQSRATACLQQASTASNMLTYSDTTITGFYVYDGFMQSGQTFPIGTLLFCEQVLDGDKLVVTQVNACA